MKSENCSDNFLNDETNKDKKIGFKPQERKTIILREKEKKALYY